MKVIIIEDEDLNAEIISNHLQKFDSSIEIVAHLKSKEEIKKWYNENDQVDLVFSDIELLDGNVFSVLKNDLIKCPIIFTTAYDTFYQDAFDVNGIGYLLKPISYSRFEIAMQKLKTLQGKEKNINWEKIANTLLKTNKVYKERIIVKNNNEITILNANTISAFLSDSGKCVAIDENGKEHIFREKISDLVDELNPNTFFQINRGEIININYIEKIETYFNDRLLIKIKNYKNKVTTSTSITPEFKRWLDK
ncbi:LytTR family DNA-binding domain-containing protein [Flavobacterium sediminilitoris]|uniref:LytTR family DNA-binding domain-containing protein n=1 Tax=Flavobacterium sediminilitoris TaxID=2024526 RepID=A0ABY4HJP3_9FLAO|nr:MULTISPECIES: LytTR family DNA-binding domain-containing protein [Flavobacterium]UOX33074.1 LytTR family DNA-binding domain-containing protein [Flavobacterium sediminilitoris]